MNFVAVAGRGWAGIPVIRGTPLARVAPTDDDPHAAARPEGREGRAIPRANTQELPCSD